MESDREPRYEYEHKINNSKVSKGVSKYETYLRQIYIVSLWYLSILYDFYSHKVISWCY